MNRTNKSFCHPSPQFSSHALISVYSHFFLSLSPSSAPSHSSPEPEELLEDEDEEDFLGGDFSESSFGFFATFLNSESDTSESEESTVALDFLFSVSLILCSLDVLFTEA